MDEPDIYGDDIYSDAPVAFGDAAQQQATASPGSAKASGDSGAGDDAAPAASAPELKAQLQQATAALEAWQRAFSSGGAAAPKSGSGAVFGAVAPSPELAAASLKAARDEAAEAQRQLATEKGRTAGLELALAEKNLENVQLRRGLRSARQAVHPSVVQVRQLLLDGAVSREFVRLRGEVEEKAREAKALQQELQAVNFSQDSKTGRMLMAKCRTLQDENEEMGRELAEGKIHGLERQVALAKGFGEDLRRCYAELEDHATFLDRENSDLQGQVFMMRRQLREMEAQLEAAKSYRSGPQADVGGYHRPYPGSGRKRPMSSEEREGGYSDSRRRLR